MNKWRHRQLHDLFKVVHLLSCGDKVGCFQRLHSSTISLWLSVRPQEGHHIVCFQASLGGLNNEVSFTRLNELGLLIPLAGDYKRFLTYLSKKMWVWLYIHTYMLVRVRACACIDTHTLYILCLYVIVLICVCIHIFLSI